MIFIAIIILTIIGMLLFFTKGIARYTLIIVLFISIGMPVVWLMTVFNRNIKAISVLITDDEVAKIYASIEENKSEELEIPLYDYDSNKYELLGRFEKSWTGNTVKNGGFPCVKKNGFLYIIIHKWKNSAAGIVWDMKGLGVKNNGKRLKYTLIGLNRYMWSLDLQQREDFIEESK